MKLIKFHITSLVAKLLTKYAKLIAITIIAILVIIVFLPFFLGLLTIIGDCNKYYSLVILLKKIYSILCGLCIYSFFCIKNTLFIGVVLVFVGIVFMTLLNFSFFYTIC